MRNCLAFLVAAVVGMHLAAERGAPRFAFLKRGCGQRREHRDLTYPDLDRPFHL